MSYIDEIFSRASIQQIRSFLLYGVDSTVNTKSYEQRIDDKHDQLFEKVQETFLERKEDFNEIEDLIYQYVNEVQDVYMEIGLQIGSFITFQAMQNFFYN